MTPPPTGKPGEWWWHVHHDRLCEALTEPVETRREYIRRWKPEGEQETRLRLLAPVRGDLPRELVRAWEARVRAWEAYDRAREAYALSRECADLHARECPGCPWDGRTISPGPDVTQPPAQLTKEEREAYDELIEDHRGMRDGKPLPDSPAGRALKKMKARSDAPSHTEANPSHNFVEDPTTGRNLCDGCGAEDPVDRMERVFNRIRNRPVT